MKVLNNIEANIRNFNEQLIANSEYFKVEYKKDFVNYEMMFSNNYYIRGYHSRQMTRNPSVNVSFAFRPQ